MGKIKTMVKNLKNIYRYIKQIELPSARRVSGHILTLITALNLIGITINPNAPTERTIGVFALTIFTFILAQRQYKIK